MNRDEFIQLLKEYKINQAKKDLNLLEKKRLLKEIEKLQDDYNVNITPTYQEGSKGNQVTSKVENMVERKDSRINEKLARIEEIDKKNEELDDRLNMVNIRLGSLNRLEKEIITDYYINELDYKTIGIETYWRIINQTRSEDTVKRKIDKIMQKMLKL